MLSCSFDRERKADIYIDDTPVAEYEVNQDPFCLFSITGEPYGTDAYAIALAKDFTFKVVILYSNH